MLQNFAGKLGSKSSQAVVTTLLKAFGQCRAFHDAPEPIPEHRFYDEFVNIVSSAFCAGVQVRKLTLWQVFFCSVSRSPLTFRTPIEDDYLHSHLRHFVLSGLDKREIPISRIRNANALSKGAEKALVLTDINNKLDEWQRHDALEHWKSRSIFISYVMTLTRSIQ